jgi:hypothetical protein
MSYQRVPPVLVLGCARGTYLCTQCDGARQPSDGPARDLVVVVSYTHWDEAAGEVDALQVFFCPPCAADVAAGAPIRTLGGGELLPAFAVDGGAP